jgi:hypothetical protein
MMPLGGGSAGALAAAAPSEGAPAAAPARHQPRPRPDEVPDPLDPPDPLDRVGGGAATALSRRAASAWRLARLRAARRCLEFWRLSGTVQR